MPIYAFECTACGHAFDRLQKLSDPDPVDCPSCSEAGLRRQLTAPAFRLAGSGWYETDFKKDGDRKRNLADGGGEGKADAKPEATTSKSDGAPAAAAPAGADKPATTAAAKPVENKPAAASS